MRTPSLLLFSMLLSLGLAHDLSAQLAADFDVVTTDQDTFSLYEDYLDQDKVVLIEFFFTSCPPCAQIAPSMEPLYQQFGGGNDDVEFLLLSNKSFDQNSDVQSYMNQYGFTFKGSGADGGALNVWNTYSDGRYGPVFGTPAFVVIAPDRTLEFNISGSGTDATIDTLTNAIRRAQAKNPSAPDTRYFENVSVSNVTDFEAFFVGYPQAGDTTRISSGSSSSVNFVPDSISETDELQVFLQKQSSPGDLLTGISTLDIALILQYILNFQKPDQLQFAAADVNNDGRLSGADIIALRKVILGLENQLPDGRSHIQFYPDYSPANPADSLNYDQIWDFPEEFDYSPSGNGVTSLPFVPVKIGDVSGAPMLQGRANLAEQIDVWIGQLNTVIKDAAGTIQVYHLNGRLIKEITVAPNEDFNLRDAGLNENQDYIFLWDNGTMMGYKRANVAPE